MLQAMARIAHSQPSNAMARIAPSPSNGSEQNFTRPKLGSLD
jgi:hypothetical protein